MMLSEMVANLEEYLGRDLTHGELEMVWRSHKAMRECESTLASIEAIVNMEPDEVRSLAASARALAEPQKDDPDRGMWH